MSYSKTSADSYAKGLKIMSAIQKAALTNNDIGKAIKQAYRGACTDNGSIDSLKPYMPPIRPLSDDNYPLHWYASEGDQATE